MGCPLLYCYQPNTCLYHAKPHLYQRVLCPPNYTKGILRLKIEVWLRNLFV